MVGVSMFGVGYGMVGLGYCRERVRYGNGKRLGMVKVRYGRDRVWKGKVGLDYGRLWQGRIW